MLKSGDRIPHFEVTTHDGSRVRYADLWQSKNLLLVALSAANRQSTGLYLSGILEHLTELTAHDTACVATFDDVPNVRPPAVAIADRWGEVHFAVETDTVKELPDVEELVEWLRYVQYQCPECQGEAR